MVRVYIPPGSPESPPDFSPEVHPFPVAKPVIVYKPSFPGAGQPKGQEVHHKDREEGELILPGHLNELHRLCLGPSNRVLALMLVPVSARGGSSGCSEVRQQSRSVITTPEVSLRKNAC